MEWDVGGGEDLDPDLEEFDFSLPRGVRREAAERSRQRRDEEAYMEGVRLEHLGSAYMEEPRRGHTDTGEEMEDPTDEALRFLSNLKGTGETVKTKLATESRCGAACRRWWKGISGGQKSGQKNRFQSISRKIR